MGFTKGDPRGSEIGRRAGLASAAVMHEKRIAQWARYGVTPEIGQAIRMQGYLAGYQAALRAQEQRSGVAQSREGEASAGLQSEAP